MADIDITEPHSLGAAKARECVADFEEMMAKYGVKAAWSGNSATLKGMAAKGSIDITDDAVRVVVKLGMMAKAAGVNPEKLSESIRKRLKAAFGTA